MASSPLPRRLDQNEKHRQSITPKHTHATRTYLFTEWDRRLNFNFYATPPLHHWRHKVLRAESSKALETHAALSWHATTPEKLLSTLSIAAKAAESPRAERAAFYRPYGTTQTRRLPSRSVHYYGSDYGTALCFSKKSSGTPGLDFLYFFPLFW